MEDRCSLQGKVALVTGAARRLGREIALMLAREGAHVVVHHRASVVQAAETADAAEELGVKAWTLGADLASPRETAQLMEEAERLAGPVDLLVNNASIFGADELSGLTRADLNTSLQVNALAPLWLARDLAGQGREAQVVNLLDTRISSHDPRRFSYQLSKRLLADLTRLLALELAPRVRVNGVAPGAILPPPGEDQAYLERLADAVPLKRIGRPDDVVQAVRFLLLCPFVTGQVIFVDGGGHLAGGRF